MNLQLTPPPPGCGWLSAAAIAAAATLGWFVLAFIRALP